MDIVTFVRLAKKILDQIIDVVLSYKKPQKLILFGSQAESSAKKTSDIDIAIIADDWTDRDYNIIKNRLEEEVKTPLKFDVVNLKSISKERLRQNILNKGKVIYES